MAGLCQICRAPNRLTVDNAIASGKLSMVQLVEKYGFNTAAFYNHKNNHMNGRTVKGQGQLVVAPLMPELKAGASDLEKVDADIKWLEDRRRDLLGKPVLEKDIAALTGQLLTARRLRAKIAGGEITPGQYARSAHFHRIWDGVVRALEDHPKALAAAVRAVLNATGLQEGDL